MLNAMRLERDWVAVGLDDEGALDEVLACECDEKTSRSVELTEAGSCGQQAATLEPQACSMGTATVMIG